MTSKATLLSKQTVNGFRYQLAVNVHGRTVFVQVVEWLYKGGPSVKAYFLSLGNSKGDYKRKFNAGQRNVLESGATFKQFDVSLLFAILQSMCGLAMYGDPMWASPPSGQPLEHLLFKVKLKRNDIEHSNNVLHMSNQELKKKLRKLKCLFSKILRLAGNRSGILPNVFRDEVWKIKKAFQEVQKSVREPLQVSDLDKLPQLQQEIKDFQDALRRKVFADSQQELHELYPELWDVALAQWLYPHLKIRPSLNTSSHQGRCVQISSIPASNPS